MTQPDLPLQHQTIFITGAARRIGRELALGSARAGADVILHHSQSPREAESLAEEIHAMGRQAHILQADFSIPEQTSRLVRDAWLIHPFQILVNNAAIFSPVIVNDTSLEEWQSHLNINLTAPFLLSQSFARCLPSDQNGRIINILDLRALAPGTDHLPYRITKAALAALTRSLSIALAPQILVNGLALGAVFPPSDGTDPQVVLRKYPIHRFATTDELIHAFLFLASGPDTIIGEILFLDGGRHLV